MAKSAGSRRSFVMVLFAWRNVIDGMKRPQLALKSLTDVHIGSARLATLTDRARRTLGRFKPLRRKPCVTPFSSRETPSQEAREIMPGIVSVGVPAKTERSNLRVHRPSWMPMRPTGIASVTATDLRSVTAVQRSRPVGPRDHRSCVKNRRFWTAIAFFCSVVGRFKLAPPIDRSLEAAIQWIRKTSRTKGLLGIRTASATPTLSYQEG